MFTIVNVSSTDDDMSGVQSTHAIYCFEGDLEKDSSKNEIRIDGNDACIEYHIQFQIANGANNFYILAL